MSATILKREIQDKLLADIATQSPSFIAKELEVLSNDKIIHTLALCNPKTTCNIWNLLSPIVQDNLFSCLPDKILHKLFANFNANDAALNLKRHAANNTATYLKYVKKHLQQEILDLLQYPNESIGSIMNHQPIAVSINLTAEQAVHLLKKNNFTNQSFIFLVDNNMLLHGQVSMNQLLFAHKKSKLLDICDNLHLTLSPFDSIEEVTTIFKTAARSVIPIVDINNKLIGEINSKKILSSAREEAFSEIQAMVGVSKDEKALSPSYIAVKKRQVWLQINLLTAFLASSVVGIFETIIAQLTALAVLLPIVAGQAGNTGAQAMAVSMRGLSLKEISPSNYFSIIIKELFAGLINGVLIAITCGIGVYLWSRNYLLALVISSSLVISMTIAGVSGALLPICMKKCGQDPAQASSIILTTITDIIGFFSFLGIAALLLI